MESSLRISLADRLRVAGRAIRGLFKQPTPQDLLGVYAGLFPGGPGSPPPRGMAELIKSYADMPWLHAVVGKIASGVASAEWKVFVVRNGDGKVKWRRDLQRADFRNRQQILAKLKKERRLEEVEDHPLPKVLEESNAFVLAAELYVRQYGIHKVFCAKLHHHSDKRCIFHCNWKQLSATNPRRIDGLD